MGIQAQDGVFKGMPVNIGHEFQGSASAATAARVRGQAHAPVAAADTNMDHRFPFALSVRLFHEFPNTLVFAGDSFNGFRRAQRGVPSGAVFCLIDVVAGQQSRACLVETTGLEQGGCRSAGVWG